ncbi:MAG TPA: hypothetical protein VKJ07_18475, partial [Mycobacteriales bacterium]|nr:hypothetical protein [Mycobacteriales bacterium]
LSVSFFGAPARMPAGPAALAVDTGAVLQPITLTYPDPRRLCLHAHPPIQPIPPINGRALDRAGQIQAMTQGLADAFAVAIKADPQDWHMLQRVWVADLDMSRTPEAVGLP